MINGIRIFIKVFCKVFVSKDFNPSVKPEKFSILFKFHESFISQPSAIGTGEKVAILKIKIRTNGIKKTNDNFVMNYFSKLFSKYIDLEGKAKSELFSITIDFIFNKRFCLTSEYSV